MRFLAKATVSFIVLLALWWWAGAVLLKPIAFLAEVFMRQAFGWAEGVRTSGLMASLDTKLRVFDTQGRSGFLTVQANLLVAAVSAPLLLAHLLATTGRKGLWWRAPAGLLALLPLQAAGVCMSWLFQVAVTHGGSTARGTGFGDVANNVIAHGYLLANLLAPTLAPVAVWLALCWREVLPQLQQFSHGRHTDR